MLAMLLSASLAFAADNDATRDSQGAKSLDGTWEVVCMEKNGQPDKDAKNATVTIKNNVITVHCAEKNTTKSMHIEFARHGKIRVTESEGRQADAKPSGENAKSGVYVLTHDYLAVCVHDAKANENEKPDNNTANASGSEQPSSKTYCTVILKRTGSSNSRSEK